jgi:hypothetical protein
LPGQHLKGLPSQLLLIFAVELRWLLSLRPRQLLEWLLAWLHPRLMLALVVQKLAVSTDSFYLPHVCVFQVPAWLLLLI